LISLIYPMLEMVIASVAGETGAAGGGGALLIHLALHAHYDEILRLWRRGPEGMGKDPGVRANPLSAAKPRAVRRSVQRDVSGESAPQARFLRSQAGRRRAERPPSVVRREC
jgi:hypothetical protein